MRELYSLHAAEGDFRELVPPTEDKSAVESKAAWHSRTMNLELITWLEQEDGTLVQGMRKLLRKSD